MVRLELDIIIKIVVLLKLNIFGYMYLNNNQYKGRGHGCEVWGVQGMFILIRI